MILPRTPRTRHSFIYIHVKSIIIISFLYLGQLMRTLHSEISLHFIKDMSLDGDLLSVAASAPNMIYQLQLKFD